jgi:hypothetical protein
MKRTWTVCVKSSIISRRKHRNNLTRGFEDLPEAKSQEWSQKKTEEFPSDLKRSLKNEPKRRPEEIPRDLAK